MNAAKLANAITMLDENILSDILEERYSRNTGIKKAEVIHRFPFAIASIAAACLLVVTLAVSYLIRQPKPNEPNTDNLLASHTPAFSSPELEALYKEYPYSEILPKKIPASLNFISSYKIEYDPIANPENKQFLALIFSAEKSTAMLEMKVMEYDGYAAAADPEKPDTYDLSLYYGYLETPGTVGADAPQMISLFRAEDISESIAEKRMYVFDDGLCKAEIEILCGDYVVAYHYTGPAITPTVFHEMITSAQWFR